jgi:MGT family glycosyltransferase
LGDWWPRELADRPLVYASLGTVIGVLPVADAAYRMLLDAMGRLGTGVRVLVTVGHDTDTGGWHAVPDHVHVERWVPQRDALAAATAVVSHGGSGTTFGALAAGRPVVVAPVFGDQVANGRVVAAAGAGIALPVDSARGTTASVALAGAVRQVLEQPGYRAAAQGIAAAVADAPTADALVASLERVRRRG